MRRNCTQPRIEVIGVRSSWESVARKLSLARFCASASLIAPLRLGRQRRGALLGDVAERDHRAEELAVLVAHRRGGELDREARAVGAEERLLRPRRTPARRARPRAAGSCATSQVSTPGNDGMHERVDVVAGDLVGGAADHPRGRGIDERRRAVQADAEHALGRGVENQLVLPDEPRQLVRLPLERLALAEQLHEDVHLRAEDLRMEGLEDVVDRAELVAAEDVRLAAARAR